MIGGFEIMAQKLKDIGMDSMEILYYERQEKRTKAYEAKKKKATIKKVGPAKKSWVKQNPDTFGRILKEAI